MHPIIAKVCINEDSNLLIQDVSKDPKEFRRQCEACENSDPENDKMSDVLISISVGDRSDSVPLCTECALHVHVYTNGDFPRIHIM